MSYRQPFTGNYGISQRFGERDTNPNGHTGIDYLCPTGTPILASAAGTVVYAGWKNGGYGYCVFLRHEDSIETVYEHLLSPLSVVVGEKVEQWQILGYSGSTGNSTGPHLHFEMRDRDRKPFDPMTLLMSVDDSVAGGQWPVVSGQLKNADAFKEGDTVRIVAPLGAKAFFRGFDGRTTFQQGTRFYYTGKTVERNGYTYMEVVPLSVPMWIAVHDEDTQILDNL